MFEALEVGKCYNVFRLSPEGVSFKIKADGIDILLTMSAPTAKEIKAIKEDQLTLGCLKIEDILGYAVIGFKPKFGSPEVADMDCPIILEKGWKECIETDISKEQGFAVRILLANNDNGELKCIRLVSLTYEFSTKLKELLVGCRELGINHLVETSMRFQRAYSTAQIARMVQFKLQ